MSKKKDLDAKPQGTMRDGVFYPGQTPLEVFEKVHSLAHYKESIYTRDYINKEINKFWDSKLRPWKKLVAFVGWCTLISLAFWKFIELMTKLVIKWLS